MTSVPGATCWSFSRVDIERTGLLEGKTTVHFGAYPCLGPSLRSRRGSCPLRRSLWPVWKLTPRRPDGGRWSSHHRLRSPTEEVGDCHVVHEGTLAVALSFREAVSPGSHGIHAEIAVLDPVSLPQRCFALLQVLYPRVTEGPEQKPVQNHRVGSCLHP